MIEKQELKKVLAALFQENRDIANNSAMKGVLMGDERETRMAIQIHGAAKGVMMVAYCFGITEEDLEAELPEEEINEILEKASASMRRKNERMAKEMVGMTLGKGPLGVMDS